MSIRMRSGAVGSIAASLISAVILLAAVSLAGLSRASADVAPPDPSATPTDTAVPTDTATPTATPTPTESGSPTVDPTPSVEPTPTPTPTVEPTPTETATPTPTPTPVPPGWQTQLFTLADGRTYYARVPVCAPVDSADCSAYLGRKRQVLVFAHGFNGVEDQATAQQFLEMFGQLRKTQGDTIFVYAVSKDGLRAWNADLCCTFESSAGVDDVGYLVNVARDLPTRAAVNAARVGVFGWSNGGMLALKADCARPDVFDFGSSWAGTWVGPCGKAGAHVMQMHGSADTTVPVTGGSTYVADHWIDVPPATDLGKQLAKGNNFPLTIYNGLNHQPNATMIALQLTWAFANLKG